MKNWVRKEIAEISSVFEDGDWIESKDQSTNGIRLIQTGNIGNGIFKDRGEKARYISEATFKRLRCKEIFEGDILVSRLPDPVGRSCILTDTGKKMITSVDCTIIRFDIKQVIPNWFSYYSLSIEYQNQIKKQITGATRERISRKNLGLISVPLPPVPEQKRIVAILDECFAAIDKAKANAEKNLKNTKELFESYLKGVFENKGEGWEIKKLGEVCKVIAGQSPEGKFYNSEGNGMPFYQGKKEYGEKYIGEPTTWTTKITKEAEAGDILMSVRAPVGPVNFATQKICIGRGLAAIRAGKNIDKEFLFNYLIKHESEIEGNTGAVFNSINKTQIENLAIPFPPLPEQQKTIIRELDALKSETQKLEALYRKKIADMEELKKSLLKKAFAGELKTEKAVAV
jgi:type I restriction enzyme S subunit